MEQVRDVYRQFRRPRIARERQNHRPFMKPISGSLHDLLLVLVCGSAIVLGVVLRIATAQGYAFWHDEWDTILHAQGLAQRDVAPGRFFDAAGLPTRSARSIIRAALEGQTPPAYELLLGACSALAGVGRLPTRIPSVVAGLATTFLTWWFVRARFGRRAALVAAGLLSVSVLAVDLSAEARSYALAALISTLATWLLSEAAQREGWWRWLAYALLTALLAYTHYFALAIPAAHAFYLVAFRRWRALRSAFLAWGAALLFYLPWLIHGLVPQWQGVEGVYADLSREFRPGYSDAATPLWVLRAAAYDVVVLLGADPAVLGARAALLMLPVVACALLATYPAVIGWVRSKDATSVEIWSLLVCTGLAPVLLLALYTLFIAGVLVPMAPRHAFFGLPALCACLGATVCSAPGTSLARRAPSMLGVLALLALGGASSFGLHRTHPVKSTTSVEEWAAQRLPERERCTVLVDDPHVALRVVALTPQASASFVWQVSLDCREVPDGDVLLLLRSEETARSCAHEQGDRLTDWVRAGPGTGLLLARR